MRTLVVGDTHGCLDELQTLLNEAALDLSQDRLVLLGDYIDRGPKSYELLQYLRTLQNVHGKYKVILLRGNHEQMAIEYLEKDNANWQYNGNGMTLRNFADKQANIKEAVNFFKTLPLFFADEHFIYVHAGLRPGIKLENQLADDLLWIREEFYRSSFDFGKTVIFGHTPTQFINGKYSPLMLSNKIALDTACVYGGVLSALEINEGRITRIYQVPAEDYRGQQTA